LHRLDPSPRVQLSMRWLRDGNIIRVCPESSQKVVQGTLSLLSTEFDLPPTPHFAPEYDLQLRLKKTLAQRFSSNLLSKIACGASSLPAPKILIDQPLLGYTQMGAHPHEKTLTRSCAVSTGKDENLVGHLQVLVVCARHLENTNKVFGLGLPGYCSDPYVVCSVRNMVRRTRTIANCLDPDWNEKMLFPLRVEDFRADIVVELFDEDRYKKQGDKLGWFILPLSSMLQQSSLRSAEGVHIKEKLLGVETGSIELHLNLEPKQTRNAKNDVESSLEEDEAEEEVCSVHFLLQR